MKVSRNDRDDYIRKTCSQRPEAGEREHLSLVTMDVES